MQTSQGRYEFNLARNAADEFTARFTGFGTVRAIVAGNDGFTTWGYFEGSTAEALSAVERIATRRTAERASRAAAREALGARLDAGEISQEQFDCELCFLLA